MKILLIDKQPHDELKFALNEHRIKVVQMYEWNRTIKPDEYGLIIFCPESKEHLVGVIKSRKPANSNIVIVYDDVDDKLITLCIGLGCRDIIKKPYNPESTAKRLECLFESLSAGEQSFISAGGNNEISCSAEEYIKKEIKRANRGKTPLALAAGEFGDKSLKAEDIPDIFDKLKACLRDTDFITYLRGYILVVMPFCSRGYADAVIGRLKKEGADCNLRFSYLVKDRYPDEPVDNEMEVMLEILEEELRRKRECSRSLRLW